MRTFSKLYGLAGLRLGFGVMPEWLADLIMRVRLPFSVNLLAEAAGMAALEDLHFRQATLETVRKGRAWLSRELERLGCDVRPSQANFILFTPPHAGQGRIRSVAGPGNHHSSAWQLRAAGMPAGEHRKRAGKPFFYSGA